MIAFCRSCRKEQQVKKVVGARCPNCNQWNSMVKLTAKQAKYLPKSARLKEARA